MGKRDKAHRKRVAARNQQIRSAQKKYQEMMNQKMMDFFKEMKEKNQSSENEETPPQSGFTLV